MNTRARKRKAEGNEDESLSKMHVKEISEKSEMITCKHCKKKFKTDKDCTCNKGKVIPILK